MWAISLLQPWAWAIFHAGKDVENRSWPLPKAFCGRRVLIASSRRVDRDYFDGACDTIETINPSVRVPSFEVIPMGVIVGAVTITGMREPTGGSAMNGWHVTDQYGFLLADSKPLPITVPCKGNRGFWRVPEDVAAKIRVMKVAA